MFAEGREETVLNASRHVSVRHIGSTVSQHVEVVYAAFLCKQRSNPPPFDRRKWSAM